VAVAHGRVGDSTRFWSFIQSAKPFGAALIELALGARLRDRGGCPAKAAALAGGGAGIGGGNGAALGFGMAVDGDIGDVGQKLGRAVLPLDRSNSSGVSSMKRVV
jgi:hypothetical protein